MLLSGNLCEIILRYLLYLSRNVQLSQISLRGCVTFPRIYHHIHSLLRLLHNCKEGIDIFADDFIVNGAKMMMMRVIMMMMAMMMMIMLKGCPALRQV